MITHTPFYHGEDHHMWTYCVHLGPFTHEGRDYDLGICDVGLLGPSLAVVTGPEAHEYISGPISYSPSEDSPFKPIYDETIRRWEKHSQHLKEKAND